MAAESSHVTNSESTDDEKSIILAKIPTCVQKVHVAGLTRTKNDIVIKHIQKVFDAKNFEEIVLKSQQAQSTLEKLGLFSKIGVGIDVSHGSHARSDGYEVTFDVKEQRFIRGGVRTMVGNNDGSVIFNVNLPNVFGRSEKINTEYTYGTKNALGCGFSFTKPLQGDPNLIFQATLFKNTGEFPWSGYRHDESGVAGELSFPTLVGSHNIRWEGIWRQLSCMSRTTAFAVREQCGHSLKSALRHTMLRDTRDDRILPNVGYKLQLSQELAGIGGDTNFMKAEGEFQYNIPLPMGTTFQMCLGAGVMKSLRLGSAIKIPDRFFLGGPMTLRGFNFKGVGPHEDNCALGADTYWCGGLHIYTPLPFRPGRDGFGDLFRLHGFVNAGNVGNVDFKGDYKDIFRNVSDGFRWSYGAGLALKLGGMARMELNYCWPMTVQRGDSTNSGIQFGVGLSFL